MKFFLIPTIILQTGLLFSQITQASVADSLPAVKRADNLLDAFKHGHFQGNFRSYLMATDNARQMSDYYALAAGGSLQFASAPWHGVSFGLGGMFNFKLASSDLSAKDSLTGAVNRYEIGLFDVNNPKNRKNLDRTEELWLRYQWKKSRVTLGQQSIQTPFINDQDGRMRPTAESGVWTEINDLKNTQIVGGFLWKISPRSTVEWFEVGESIGLYPKGLNPDGTGSGYPENLKSKGIGILGIKQQWGKRTEFQVWNQYVENIFNTAFVQADYTLPLKNNQQWLLGLQMMHQSALAHGGNEDVSKTYFQKGGRSNAVSAQTGMKKGQWQALLAYTRVTADGRFLAPREWGREPFYTFMARERVEGSGDSHSMTGRVNWQNKNKNLRLGVAYGRFYLPNVDNVALNKYAFPSFQQLNLDVRYAFGGMLKGLNLQFLYVWKGRLGEVYGNERYVINRVDMSHYNLVFNYSY
ncbi:MAG: OprD family outer membrane porin [Saprospiraceae bacterium]